MINYTFGILPTIMRHDARISDFACRLYSEVDSLSNKYGYCFATNAVLAKNLKKSPSQISRTLSELEGFGYVSLVFEDGYKRKIYPKRDFRDMEGVDEIAEWGTQKCVGVYAELQKGVRKNSMTVNKIINKEKHIEIINKEKPFVEETSTVTLIDEVDETMVEIHHVPEYFEGEIPEFKLNEKGNLSPFSNFNEVINELDSKATQEKERKSSAKKKETPTPQVAPPPRPKAKRETTAKEMDLVFQVVQYLNEKTEQAFQPGGEKTKSLILARHHADKWGLEDFKTVIDHKKSEWFVKDNLRQYLRPSTLFAAGHAEEYLQAAKLWKKKPVATSPGVVPLFRQENYNNVDKSKFKF